jgi:hypothetical protein
MCKACGKRSDLFKIRRGELVDVGGPAQAGPSVPSAQTRRRSGRKRKRDVETDSEHEENKKIKVYIFALYICSPLLTCGAFSTASQAQTGLISNSLFLTTERILYFWL